MSSSRRGWRLKYLPILSITSVWWSPATLNQVTVGRSLKGRHSSMEETRFSRKLPSS